LAGLIDTSVEMFKLCELGASQHPAGIDEVVDQIILGLISRPKRVHPPLVKRLQFLPALTGQNPPRRRPKSVFQTVQPGPRFRLFRRPSAELRIPTIGSNLQFASHDVSTDKGLLLINFFTTLCPS
jgi:hypothetical protein